MFKKILWIIPAVFVIFLLVISVNTLMLTSEKETVVAVTPIRIDKDAAVLRLSKSVRIRTISHQDSAKFNPAPFAEFHQFLKQSFPGLHQTLERTVINEHSLLYRWQGSDPKLKPMAFLAHMDVVPVEPGTENNWTHGAYSGDIADGYVWGRGMMDMKGILMAIMEAVEELVKLGFVPKRTLYLAFGHDEEVGGRNGAREIAAHLKKTGIQLSFTLDEAMAIASREISPVKRQLAVIGLAEKGHLTLKITATTKGGHSSMPPVKTTLGILARAIYRLEQNQMPASLDGPTGMLYDTIVPEMSLVRKVLMANQWAFKGLLLGQLRKSTYANAGIRTTTAPTMIRGGVKENVLPSQAHVIVNFRLKPGDKVSDVVAHVKKTIDDPAIDIAISGRGGAEASPVSSIDDPAYKTVKRSISEIFPGTLVAPGLVYGGTDSKHYASISDNNYRFAPMIIGPSDQGRIHGTDERLGIDNYEKMIQFYAQLLKNVSGSNEVN